MIQARNVATQLAQRAESVVSYLLPNGKKVGNEWKVGSIKGERGESLAIHLGGDKSGIWCDFASGEKGDLLDLWAAVRALKLADAIKEAAEWLGISVVQFEPARRLNFHKPSPEWEAITPTSSVMNYLVQERKLLPEIISAFSIGQLNNSIIFPYYRNQELIFAKYLQLGRVDGKKQVRASKGCEPCLFGWDLIPADARKITICEGEIDAMTLYQYGIPALSVPFGGGVGAKHKWLEYEYDRLAHFDEIYLCMDQDKEGVAATNELAERLGRHRCRIVELPYKDANECLQVGVTADEIKLCFDKAESLDPIELKSARQFVDEVIGEFYPLDNISPGVIPPWEKARTRVLFRPDELSIWSGINGHGKSQLIGQVVLASMQQGVKVCIASLELKPKRLLMRLTKQAGALDKPSEAYIQAIHEWYGDKLWVFDLVGTAKVERLLEVFLYARQRYGIEVFVIDSFMKLGIAEDDYKAQKEFIEQLCDFKNQHNCHIHLIVHPRKGADETQAPGKLDYKGTGAISDLSDNCFTVWRNKQKEKLKRKQEQGFSLTPQQLADLDKPDCLWMCDKQRNGDWEGGISLWFDPATYQYLNHSSQRPIRYVEFSINNGGRS